MRFLVDNQLPVALARFIHYDLKADAAHVADLGLLSTTDEELWQFASKTGSILISKDEDFVNMALTSPTARLLWIRIGNCRRAVLLEQIARVWDRVMVKLEAGERFIEIR